MSDDLSRPAGTKPRLPNTTMTTTELAARNRRIFATRAKGETLKQIAATHGISVERVRQILNNGYHGRTITLLPGSEKLSPITRGRLLRLGYSHADAVVADVQAGRLYSGCAFGIGGRRFSEIEAWARNRMRNTVTGF